MLRIGLAIFGLGIVLASPAVAAGDSRFAMIVELPWNGGRAIQVGRDAGGLLVRAGWHNALFYFPEGVDRPDWTDGTATVPVRGTFAACGTTT